ncbi:outer membrane transport energization protein ExbB [Nitrosomonas aestuarii]|uniref:Outer membrane transport energization protein ExbB n=1 Tax=Nitrosomonas aestuarii TaxID=52441 RepID=A0A1I4EC60_9PROT|nr:MotA/TolQ/ExbB proton channel family protein [Nitrosomonas aestuarii]SFL03335.1 outer membrane transport energization protein ExbB [Nitrosomonas aestuarii]
MKRNCLVFLTLAVSAVIIFASISAHAEESVNAETVSPATGPTPAAKPAAAANSQQQSPAQEKINLETAYKREYAFLEAQKRELIERLKKYQSSIQSEERGLNNKISVLERGSIERSAKIDQLNTLLAEAERDEAAVFERSDALEITYAQAEATLKNHEITVPASLIEMRGADPTKVGYIFNQALSLIRELGMIQTEQGTFFLENGKQTQGEIIRLGNIAAYGVSPEGSGSLVPAGGGDFKIWREPSADSAIALSKNQQPELLQLFLFESRTQVIDEMAEKTILEVIHSGGIIGWVIVGLGGLVLLLACVRIYLLRANSSNTHALSDQVVQQVIAGDLEAAKKSSEAGSAAITRVLSNTLRHLKDDRDHMESVVHEAILRESGVLDRFGSAILVIASVSPLLGLLGTVTGMIATFDVITEFGTGDPKLLSGGISIALVTTKLGLIVAIPALLVGSVLSAWARNIKRDMEHAALRVTNAFLGAPMSELQTSSAELSASNMTPAPGHLSR